MNRANLGYWYIIAMSLFQQFLSLCKTDNLIIYTKCYIYIYHFYHFSLLKKYIIHTLLV